MAACEVLNDQHIPAGEYTGSWTGDLVSFGMYTVRVGIDAEHENTIVRVKVNRSSIRVFVIA